MDAANARRDFRRALALVPGPQAKDWTPRELRHSFVSSQAGAEWVKGGAKRKSVAMPRS
jgi:hypothetical protein